MSEINKSEKVEFYLDRSKEAAVRIVHSLITDPSISQADVLRLIKEIADHHDTIAAFIFDKLGEDRQNPAAGVSPNSSQVH